MHLPKWTLPAALGLGFASLAIPVLMVDVPPLGDYPNHLTRIWLLSGGLREPPLSAMFQPAWESARTNVGMDYLAVLLGSILPAQLVGSLCVLLAVVLPPLGALAVHRAAFGGAGWWQLALAGLAWNATLMAGFVNFQMGLGCALLAAALEPRIGRCSAPAAFALRFLLGLLVMSVHVFGLLLYAGLAAAMAFGPRLPDLRHWRDEVWRLGRALAAGLAVALALVPLLLVATSLPGAHVAPADTGPVWFFGVAHKLGVLYTAVATYSLPFDLAFAALLAAIALVALAIGRLDVHGGLLLLGGVLVLLALLAPSALAGTWWIDHRFPAMAGLVLVAAVRPRLDMAERWALLAALALALAVGARTLVVGSAWLAAQHDIRSVRRAVEPVPAGAALLPLDHGGPGAEPRAYPWGRYYYLSQPAHWYYPVLAIMWRRAFVPSLYWAAGKQPIRVLPPWSEISFPEVGLSASRSLVEPDFEAGYFRAWRTRYDFVLLVNADVGTGMDLAGVPELELVRDEGFARLYRIRR